MKAVFRFVIVVSIIVFIMVLLRYLKVPELYVGAAVGAIGVVTHLIIDEYQKS